MKTHPLTWAAAVAIVAVVVFLWLWGIPKLERQRAACEAAGGVEVRTSEGYTCIDAKRIKP